MGKFLKIVGGVLRDGLAAIGAVVATAGLASLLGVRRLRQGIPPKSFALVASDGSTLMDVTAVEFRGQDVALRGNMMGTMPTVARLTPAETAKAIRLVPLELLRGLPGFVADIFGLRRTVTV